MYSLRRAFIISVLMMIPFPVRYGAAAGLTLVDDGDVLVTDGVVRTKQASQAPSVFIFVGERSEHVNSRRRAKG